MIATLRKALFFCLSACLLSCVGNDGSDTYQTEKKKFFHWRLQSQSSKSGFEFQALQQMAEKIAIMTDGKLSITVYQKNLLAQREDIFQKVKKGSIEIGMGSPSWWKNVDLGWAAIQSGPFGFMNLDASMMFFLEGKGTSLANQLSQQHGIIWRPAVWSGMEFGLLTTFPAQYLSDLKGRTFVMEEGLGAELLRTVAGVKTVQIPPTEIHGAIRDGKVHGVEWGTADETFYMKFHRLCDYAIAPAIWQPSVLSDFLIAQKAYNQLPYPYQVALETALKEFSLTMTMRKKRKDFIAMESFLDFGTRISVWSADDVRTWKRASDQLYEKYSEKSYSFRRILDFKKKFKKQYNQYYQIHGAYINTKDIGYQSPVGSK